MPYSPATIRKRDLRPSPSKRGYRADWKRLRNRHARKNPLCVACLAEGRITPVEQVDHVIPIRDAPERRLDETNLQSLCGTHHSQKTRAGG